MPAQSNRLIAAVPFSPADLANLRYNQYVRRLIEDAQLRANVQQAFESSRNAYARLTDGKAPHRALLEDKKLQKELRQAAQAIRDASIALTEPPKKKRRFGRMVFLVLVTGGIALALSEKLRSKVLDTLFGAEEEFEYTPPASTTPTPPTPPAQPVSSA
jgi:hypothetical protein